jgi:hypothetical protein
MYIRQDYTLHMPQIKQIESGRIVPVKVNYNKVVYVTELEKKRLNIKYNIFVVAGIVFGLFICVRSNFKKT